MRTRWASLLAKGLTARQKQIMRAATRVARCQRVPLYLVGGAVRDLLLGRTPKDLDFLVEGSTHRFARQLASRLRARWQYQGQFLTATVWVSGRPVNIARARLENYPRPGALPKVTPSNVEQDLRRRDFSANAMALGLHGRHRGLMLDPCAGTADLKRRLLRVLHRRSFIDDPTRILRGIRLSARLNMKFEPATLRLARSAIRQGMVSRVSADRWRCEVLLLLAEPDPVAAIQAGRKVGAIQSLLPGLRAGSRLRSALGRASQIASACGQDVESLRLLSLLGCTRSASETARRLGLQGRLAAAAAALERLRPAVSSLGSRRPSTVARILERAPVESVAALAALAMSERSRQAIMRYLLEWRFAKPRITGSDLLRRGVAPGPAVGAGLRAARYALMDGRASTRQRQLEVALRHSRRWQRPA